MKQIVKGTKEQRINRMMRMALEWQNDINNKKTSLKNSSYYFRTYHIGPYKTELFSDIASANITREWVIDKMNLCSAHKKLLKQNLEERKIASKISISQPSLFEDENVDNIVSINKDTTEFVLSGLSDETLINELKSRNYKVIREY